MFGFTSAEMLFIIQREFQNPSLLERFNREFHLILPFQEKQFKFESEEYKTLANDIRHFTSEKRILMVKH